MTGPLTPEDPTPQPLHQIGGDAEQAERTVKEVIRWYNARLTTAQRQPDHDVAEVANWRQARDEAVDALDRLESASEDETVQISLAYAARLKELGTP
ncbi:hypothetical protein [Streptomyces sp. NPDC047718]|uniref:hypothetical protein n=1 Tax=Streptomyces sp. NPDC047718 TaxID=3155479 RepID=UPI0033F109D4